MNKSRLALQEDYQRIKSFCDAYKIQMPETNTIFLVEDDKRNILAIAGVMTPAHIEPLIGKHPSNANTVLKLAEGAILNSGARKVRIIADKKYANMYEKYGFKKIDEDKILMEKDYYGTI
jgi:hypothetical protein